MTAHIFYLCLKTAYFFHTVLSTPGFRFHMIKLRIRIIYDQMLTLSYFQAQINIIKCHCQFFGKSACLLKNFLLHHQTRCRNCAHILQKGCFMEIAGTVCRHINKHMSCNPAHSDHTACMLDRIIRIYKLRANSANFRTLAHTQHFFHPVRINGFYIIIQKQQVFSPCMGSTKIINRRIIKFLPPSQKADPWIR